MCVVIVMMILMFIILTFIILIFILYYTTTTHYTTTVYQRSEKIKKLSEVGAVGDVHNMKGAKGFFDRVQKAKEKVTHDEDIFAFSNARWLQSRKQIAEGFKVSSGVVMMIVVMI